MSKALLIAGRGVRLANAVNELVKFAMSQDVDVVTTVLGKDLLDSSISKGTIGIRGTANYLIDEADTIIVLGASFPVAQMGYDYKRLNKKDIIYINVERPNGMVRCNFVRMDAGEYLRFCNTIE